MNTTPSSESLDRGPAGTGAASHRRRASWRVIDIVIASVLAVVCGVIFWIWSNAVSPATQTATVGFPPLSGLIGGGWLLAGVIGGLVIRKPGAAIYCEMVAAVIEALLGTHYSAGVLLSGAIQGIGAEIVFAALLYRRFGLPTALLSGAVSGLFMGVSEVVMYYAFWEPQYQVVYVMCAVVSGLLIAGFLSWALMRALISTGVLGSVAAGRDARQMRRRA
ncbi:ECF transporter S component [Rothia sp. HC945]|jgi:energy-coupling factor transport system substrate-specific component|uniref:ECF transporter S component n=1 Tax=Rothia sp. HC945 TaxID=3171170 RepID=UPI00264C3B54|nr:ECF transporter S component [Kocuria sp.]MDN5617571.1 ECF transporter S component [Kocuria sp.]MDN5653924.1 ECF transporter S component [Kocuria sp.]